jgi:hypothetical protein
MADDTDNKGRNSGDPRERLLWRMKVTKGSRFNSSKRLEARDRRMTALVAWASIFVIILTICPVFLKSPDRIITLINMATVCLSLVILCASLLQYSNGDQGRAEQLHRCALEIGGVHRRLEADQACAGQGLQTYADEYSKALERYSINHDDVDYQQYMVERPDEFPGEVGWFLKLRHGLKVWWLRFWHFGTIIFMASITVAIILYSAYLAVSTSAPAG